MCTLGGGMSIWMSRIKLSTMMWYRINVSVGRASVKGYVFNITNVANTKTRLRGIQ